MQTGMMTMTDNDDTYNGWATYETWLVNLWLSNDEGSYTYWQEQALEFIASSDAEPADRRDDAIYRLAAELADEMEAGACFALGSEDDTLPATLFADLITAALGSVDWREIAEHLITDALECAAFANNQEAGP